MNTPARRRDDRSDPMPPATVGATPEPSPSGNGAAVAALLVSISMPDDDFVGDVLAARDAVTPEPQAGPQAGRRRGRPD
jgi:hypothetical protein